MPNAPQFSPSLLTIQQLHQCLDHLMAAWAMDQPHAPHGSKLFSNTPIMELAQWSNAKVQEENKRVRTQKHIDMDFTKADELTFEVESAINEAFENQGWDSEQIDAGSAVRNSLAMAVKIIVAQVPPSEDRSVAIRKIREAAMDCNSAISHRGRY